jgi:hypothetical protein
VFFGTAVSPFCQLRKSQYYTYETLRAVTKIRGGLVTIIYSTTQELHTTAINESAASSLMSIDVERIAQSLELVYNLWATPIELGIAIYLLERQLGAACVAVVILAIGTYPHFSLHDSCSLTGVRLCYELSTTVLQSRKKPRSMACCNSKTAERHQFNAWFSQRDQND